MSKEKVLIVCDSFDDVKHLLSEIKGLGKEPEVIILQNQHTGEEISAKDWANGLLAKIKEASPRPKKVRSSEGIAAMMNRLGGKK